MIKEITKTITEQIKICDICNESASYTCAVCSKDICGAHMIIVSGYNNTAYICSQCNQKPFSEMWNKLYVYLNTTVTIYPVIKYEYQWQYRAGNGTGDYWVLPTYTNSDAVYSKE